ncbi:MAG TPA: hypothetical protein DHV36_20750, partial [Desulfobacteraceae bacterium]|nr:hypothetical protein [Desulfobacteraceae bacterium]
MNQEGHAKIISALEALSTIADSFKTGISGQDAQQLVQTASDLKQMLVNRDRLAPVGQIIFSLGKFLAANPSSAPQGAVSLLEKQLATLTTLVADNNPDPTVQDRLVKESIEDFKAFRESISLPAPDPKDLDQLK